MATEAVLARSDLGCGKEEAIGQMRTDEGRSRRQRLYAQDCRPDSAQTKLSYTETPNFHPAKLSPRFENEPSKCRPRDGETFFYSCIFFSL